MNTDLQQLAERVFYLPHEEPTDRPALGYVRGDRYALAVDAGNSRRHVEKFYAALDDAGLRRPDFTALTHWHWDHTFGLHAVGGVTIACAATSEMLRRAARWKWDEAAMRERLRTGEEIEFCDTHIRAEYLDRREICVVPAGFAFTGCLSIDLGGVRCVLSQIEAPHERDCVLVQVPEQGVLFAGDADCGDLYGLGGEYDKMRLEHYFTTMEAMTFEQYVPGHSAPERKEETLAVLRAELAGAGD